MKINLITQEDLEEFKIELLKQITQLLAPSTEKKEWLRSKDVMERLGISAGTLQNLRITGKLPYKKVNGMLFYSSQMMERMMMDE